MFDYCSMCFLEAEPRGNVGHSTALGGAVKLAGYTAHPQNMASLLMGSAQQKNTTEFPYLPEFMWIYC
jgi:hypothetical protein